MLKELGGHVFVSGIHRAIGPLSQLQGHVQHGQGVKGHPRRAISLL